MLHHPPTTPFPFDRGHKGENLQTWKLSKYVIVVSVPYAIVHVYCTQGNCSVKVFCILQIVGCREFNWRTLNIFHEQLKVYIINRTCSNKHGKCGRPLKVKIFFFTDVLFMVSKRTALENRKQLKIPALIQIMVSEQFMKMFQNCAFCAIVQFWNIFVNCTVTIMP